MLNIATVSDIIDIIIEPPGYSAPGTGTRDNFLRRVESSTL
jgi:hypothetical protein